MGFRFGGEYTAGEVMNLIERSEQQLVTAKKEPVRVKLERINCDVSRSLPPERNRQAWIDRLKTSLGTASIEYIDATLYQLQAAARLPNSGVSEIAVNSALAMIESEQPKTETECAIVIQMACLHSATMAVLGRLGGGHGGDRHVMAAATAASRLSRSFAVLVETLRRLRTGGSGGLKFLDAAHIKDMLALLRFVENPRDRVAGFRLMHLIPGVGPTSAQRVLDHMADDADPIAALALAPAPPRAGEAWTTFIGAVADLRHSNWPADLERARLWYEPHLDRIHDDAETRRADVIQLEQIASGYPSRERFLTELTLDPPDATSDQAGVPLLDEDYLILSTIHSAKGQEWKSVFVLNVVDGCMPSDLGIGTSAELEEECRLLYVAMTRAKDDLHLIVPQRFFTHGQHAQGDRHIYASRTRFIPDRLLGLFEKTVWPMGIVGAAARPASQGPRIDVGARMRGVWR
jgi:hypothetical protein